MNTKRLIKAVRDNRFIIPMFTLGLVNMFLCLIPFVIDNPTKYFYVMSMVNVCVALFMFHRVYVLTRIELIRQEVD